MEVGSQTRRIVDPPRQLTEEKDIFGEIVGVGENQILTVAWEAVERRRQAAKKRGKQLQLNDTPREEGYAVYNDYDQYMEERKLTEGLKLPGWDFRRVREEIKEALLSKGWTISRKYPETRFYPPANTSGLQAPTLL